MITAKEARLLSGSTAQEEVDALQPSIEEACKRGERELHARTDLWTTGAYNRTKKYTEAVAILEGLGYTVEFFYEERQFVNMYTIIRWQ